MDEYTLETFIHNGYTVKIIADQDAESPRTAYDNVGKMVCWHRHYNLGDEQRRDDASDFMMELAEEFRPGLNDWLGNDLFRKLVKADSGTNLSLYREQNKIYAQRCHEIVHKVIDAHYIMLPLGLYDHSGISMYIGSGSHATDGGGWDSGQVGWIYCTKQKAVEEWGKKICSKRVREKALKWLETEVEVYDQYLTGDVWGYVIEDPDENEIGSCWGFFGSEYCKQEAISAVPDEPAPKGGDSEDEAHEETLVA